MIKDSVKIHDDFSIEIKSIYENISKRKKTRYNTLTYLFLPNGLNINDLTYTKAKFYNDVKVYIRYDASEYTLDDLINLKTGPLKQLHKISKKIIESKTTEKTKLEFESKVKMLGAILNNTLKLQFTFIKNKDNIDSVDLDFIVKLKKILENYRYLLLKIENSNTQDSLKRISRYADEYMSNITNYYFIDLLDYYKNDSKVRAYFKQNSCYVAF